MRRYPLVVMFVLLSFSPASWAYFQMDLLKSKNAAAKQSAQFTLADWLAQKGKISVWDQWLALHRQVQWLEVVPSARAVNYQLTTKTASGSTSVSQTAQQYNLDFYIGLLNLNGEYSKTSGDEEDFGGAAGLRLFGLSAQSTSLVGRYGWRKRQQLKTQEVWENTYVEGELQLYVVQPFGLTGKYRYYFPSESNQGTRFQGVSESAGAFFEVGFVRVFGNYLLEPTELTKNGVVTKESRAGYDVGIKLLF